MKLSLSQRYDKLGSRVFAILVWLMVVTGILLRIINWWHNRNITLDESNVARNLFERGFAGLTMPLSYEQYAPPVFLWIEKLVTLIAGFGEQALRFYPLLCGIASLFIFRKVLQYFMKDYAAWLPMALMAFTYLFIRYSSEVKQYMPDVMITLLLIWLTLTTDIIKTSRKKFVLTWVLAGTLAIWSSMPSVFILSGAGCYYAWHCYRAKNRKMFVMLCGVSLVWAGQFAVYFFSMLQQQADSDFLQFFHHEYFLYGRPHNAEEWRHNKDRLLEIIDNAGGYHYYVQNINIILIVIAGLWLLLRDTARFFLLAVPVAFTLLAAALNKFTLVERVILFMQPLIIIFIGIGFWRLMRIKFLLSQILLIVYGVFVIYHYNSLWVFQRMMVFQEITPGMEYLRKEHTTGNDLYIHHATGPVFIYYTQIHPGRERWNRLQGARVLKWDENYADHTKNITDTVYFLYTGGAPEDELNKRRAQVEVNLRRIGGFDTTFPCTVDKYVPKDTTQFLVR